MACALTHDDPVNDCRQRSGTWLAVTVGGILLLAGGALVAVWIRLRRRPRAGRT